MIKMVLIFLVNIVLAPAFAQQDIRAMAREELDKSKLETPAPKDSKKGRTPKSADPVVTEPGPTPSIMLPLHDPYKPVSMRSWLWSMDVGLTAQKILVTKPAFVLGRNDLSELGMLPFFTLNFGFEKPQAWGGWGLSLIAATTVKSEEVLGSAGAYKANLQWLSYGLEPHISKKWNSWIGTTAAVQYELVSVAQTSGQSDFARWSQNFSSSNLRLGLDGYVSEQQMVTVSLIQKNSDFGRTLAWALTYGVKW